MKRRPLILELVKFIPEEERVELLRKLLAINDGSVKRTAEAIGAARAQVYRYLGMGRRHNYPSNDVTVRILEALLEKEAEWTKEKLRKTLKRFEELLNQLS